MNKRPVKLFLLLIFAVIAGLGLVYALPGNNEGFIAYISNTGDGTISVVDTRRGELIDTIKIGTAISHGIATTPDGRKIYIGDQENDRILIYDTDAKRVVKTIDINRNVHGIDITPGGGFVFVASGALEIDDEFDYIDIIDTKTDDIVKTIRSGGRSPSHIDFSSDVKFAFAANVMSNSISVIGIEDIEKAEVLYSIDVGIMPNELEVSPDNRFLYAANVLDGSISIIDTDKKEEIRRIKVGEGAHGVALSRDGVRVWTANRFANSVRVVDVVKGEVLQDISLEGEPNHIIISPDGRYAYVTSLKSNDLTIIDTNTYGIIKQIKLGKAPHEIALVKR